MKAWCACKIMSKLYGLGDPNGFVFNMSVGYDLEGVKGEKVDTFLNGMMNAGLFALDMDALTNVESLSFSFDPTKGVLPIVYIQNQLTRVPIPIPIPNLNPLQPPLGALPTPIANFKVLKDTAKMSPMRAISAGLAEAAKSQDAVSGSGSLNVLRYGRVLKARGLVGVRGAGVAYDGHVATMTVTVTDDGSGNLTATTPAIAQASGGDFVNTYTTELDYSARAGVRLSKTLCGRAMEAGQFAFTVTADAETAANIAPVLISAASSVKGCDPTAAITTVTTIGYGGLMAGPALLGFIAQHKSLETAFLFIAALLMMALLNEIRVSRQLTAKS